MFDLSSWLTTTSENSVGATKYQRAAVRLAACTTPTVLSAISIRLSSCRRTLQHLVHFRVRTRIQLSFELAHDNFADYEKTPCSANSRYSAGDIPNHLRNTSSLCCPKHGAGWRTLPGVSLS